VSTPLANQPAFPHVADVLQIHPDGSTTVRPVTSGGMTLRQHYAGLAMQGMMADGLVREDLDGDKNCYQVFAINAVKMADALLAALEDKK